MYLSHYDVHRNKKKKNQSVPLLSPAYESEEYTSLSRLNSYGATIELRKAIIQGETNLQLTWFVSRFVSILGSSVVY